MIQDIEPSEFDNHYISVRTPKESDYFLFFNSGGKLILNNDESFLKIKEARYIFYDNLQFLYLFSVDGKGIFTVWDEKERWKIEKRLEEIQIKGRIQLLGIRNLRFDHKLPKIMMFTIFTAKHLNDWYSSNIFCGKCGNKLIHKKDERALACPACKSVIYPRINPAVIAAVTNNDKLLLTKYSDRDLPYYALVAGFTEIGETLEQTVKREVMEETGLKVKNIRYYKSQPWAPADDILMGFFCDVDGSDEIHIDLNELKTGIWVRRENIIGQPDDYSLSNEMMKIYRDGLEPLKH